MDRIGRIRIKTNLFRSEHFIKLGDITNIPLPPPSPEPPLILNDTFDFLDEVDVVCLGNGKDLDYNENVINVEDEDTSEASKSKQDLLSAAKQIQVMTKKIEILKKCLMKGDRLALINKAYIERQIMEDEISLEGAKRRYDEAKRIHLKFRSKDIVKDGAEIKKSSSAATMHTKPSSKGFHQRPQSSVATFRPETSKSKSLNPQPSSKGISSHSKPSATGSTSRSKSSYSNPTPNNIFSQAKILANPKRKEIQDIVLDWTQKYWTAHPYLMSDALCIKKLFKNIENLNKILMTLKGSNQDTGRIQKLIMEDQEKLKDAKKRYKEKLKHLSAFEDRSKNKDLVGKNSSATMLQPKSSTAKMSSPSNKRQKTNNSTEIVNEIYTTCVLCNVQCHKNNIDSHMKGKKHAKALKKMLDTQR